MSVDIRKQLDLHPYSDKNVVQKPVVQTQPQVQQPADEEKSNAAKWMIGLTATAAIVLGGLYAAKHGHLGKDAEKFAKKVLGSGTKEAGNTQNTTIPKASTTTNTTNTTGTTESNIPPIASALSVAPLVFARKGISRLIKNPNKSLSEVMSEFQQAGVHIEKKGENLLAIRTGKKAEDITELQFNADGTLESIKRAGKNLKEEIFIFENSKLKKIERAYSNLAADFRHIIKFDDSGEKVVYQEYNFRRFERYGIETRSSVESILGKKNILETGDIATWNSYIKLNFDKLPKSLKRVKIFNMTEVALRSIENAPYLTAQTAKYFRSKIKDIPNTVSSEDLVSLFHYKNSELYNDLVENIKFVRRVANKTVDSNDDAGELSQIIQQESTFIQRNNIRDAIKAYCTDEARAELLLKIIEKDIGSTERIGENSLIYALKRYNLTLKQFSITKTEQFEAVAKPLNKCSKQDFIALLGSRDAVHKKLPGCFDDYEMLDVEYLSSLPGFSHVKNNMTPFDILQDLAK